LFYGRFENQPGAMAFDTCATTLQRDCVRIKKSGMSTLGCFVVAEAILQTATATFNSSMMLAFRHFAGSDLYTTAMQRILRVLSRF
jgi:hypothetical protein